MYNKSDFSWTSEKHLLPLILHNFFATSVSRDCSSDMSSMSSLNAYSIVTPTFFSSKDGVILIFYLSLASFHNKAINVNKEEPREGNKSKLAQ